MNIAASRATVERVFSLVTLAKDMNHIDDIRALHGIIHDQPRDELEELALVLSAILARTSNPEIVRELALSVAKEPNCGCWIL